MKKLALTLQSTNTINDYIADNHLMRYEREILNELIHLIAVGDENKLAWFAGFGEDFRHITMNINGYRRSLIYGFTEIAFNQYGWLESPKFLDLEEIVLAESCIRIGRGPNNLWTYALSRSYGMAGASGPLCIFCPPFKSREIALNTALAEIKKDFSSNIGNTDTSNFKPDLIIKTLKAITAVEVSMVQLSLF